ncbi:MAG: ribonuclease Y [Kiritimatiellia bacterium]|jgi:ribonuclease Y|nr:ribonuclease Y [Kiritimatiellia bacterium]MDP6630682.1 ribonuclease Y [Kiritimatiellia bacterium]MDP6809455.1 ribonuclease Y [Kiritimatiellia bacterium]MDP7023868.1 ribonuclease Y [Kiritimatiellia bacterium]
MNVIIGLVAALGGLAVGYLVRHVLGKLKADAVEKRAEVSMTEAEREAEAIRKEGQIHAKAEVLKAREEFEKSTKKRRKELETIEERVSQRETNLDRKMALVEKKEHQTDSRSAEVEERIKQVEARDAKAKALIEEEMQKLQRVAGMTRDEAKQSLLERVEQEAHNETGGLIRRLQETAKETAEAEAKRIVAMAIQRYGASHASAITTSIVQLPSDDMKGRIIGRDGRNIRTLESVTGVNLLIDDTPEAVVISGFDPLRREVARQSLEILVADGRIHPARIEEIVEKVREEMEDTIRKYGEEAAFEADVQNVEPELLRRLGRLQYRTSYSQNVLRHSIEVARLMGMMAGEMDLDVSLARRIGLFHDIGKALDHEVEGGHALIGADLLKRHNEAPVVVNAVAAHHDDVEAESIYAFLAAAGDAISSSRLGARSETTEIYLKRLENLEQIANGFEGVTKSYAIQAGREVRVLVQPDAIDDNDAMVLARNVSKKIESDLQYPGQIRVTVVRETRCVEYAR